ncbi:hypothetical protein [Brevibacillus brevis]|uniref:hypothetical protein n=1 Tax=Brevibacillus brevis TaxID=1393 RepID=UPI000D0F3A35|nr:hypothetical protein [Brevibacillus brevis]PSJ66315.1 hypothetical protein C7J99_26630 [Brevibacillus brevis]RED21827.1 hypothetical protein DES34_11892 [Brevibacillus brevis]GEC93067.1 hypothetical protein BBR01nite_53980 [Brevibacillus brevis]VEF92690.1 Uncharacterised protein [Brevibacillus brevis]
MSTIATIYNHLSNGNSIGVTDRERFGITSVAEIIRELASSHRALFHGTRDIISSGAKLNIKAQSNRHLVYSMVNPPGTPIAFASNYANILMIKALFSNKYGLGYSYGDIDEVKLPKQTDEVVFQKGYIYLLKNTHSFQKANYSDWEYFSTEDETVFAGSIEITLDDWPDNISIYQKIDLETLKK